MGTINAAHGEYPQSSCSQVQRVSSPGWCNRAVVLGVKYQLHKDVERRGRFQSVPLFPVRVRNRDIWRNNHLREWKIEISRQQVQCLCLHPSGSIRSQGEFHETTSGGPRGLSLSTAVCEYQRLGWDEIPQTLLVLDETNRPIMPTTSDAFLSLSSSQN